MPKQKKTYLHVFTCNNQVIRSFIDLIDSREELYSEYKHKVLMMNCAWTNYFENKTTDFYENIEIIISKSPTDVRKVFYIETKNADKVFIHHLCGDKLLMLFLLLPSIIKKTYWVLWGGDLYYYNSIRYRTNIRRRTKTLRSTIWKFYIEISMRVFEYFRKIVISNTPYVICEVDEELNQLKEWYKTKAKLLVAPYPSVAKYEHLDAVYSEKNKNNTKTVLVGISADTLNEHHEIIEKLSNHTGLSDMKVMCILSYGGGGNYVKSVIDFGHEKLGNSFEAILDYRSPAEYGRLLSNIDTVVINVKRRMRGLGTIKLLLYLGKKVYLKSDLMIYQYFKRKGFVIYDTNDFLQGDLSDLFSFPVRYQLQNRDLIDNIYSEEAVTKAWENIFCS